MSGGGWGNTPDRVLIFFGLIVALALPIHWALAQKSLSCLLKSFTVSIIHPFHLLCPFLLGYWSQFVSKWIPLPSKLMSP